MNYIYANVILGIKVLLKDKITLLWSILLPTVFLFFNKSDSFNEFMLTFWYAYIVINMYIYGVGVYAIEARETEFLKTLFSLKNNSILFFLSTLITQIIFSFISIAVLNVAAVLLFKFNYLYISYLGLKTMFLLIPVSFLFFNLTLIKSITANSLKSITSLTILAFFIMIPYNTEINPFYLLMNYCYDMNFNKLLVYIVVSLLIIACSMYSIINFEPIKQERRG